MEADAPYQSARTKHSIPAIVSAAAIAALTVGSGVFAYQQNQNNRTKEVLQAQINDLKERDSSARTASTPGIVSSTPMAEVVPSANPTAAIKAGATSTPDVTASWKTYAGKYFSFKYPTYLTLVQSNSTPANPDYVDFSFNDSKSSIYVTVVPTGPDNKYLTPDQDISNSPANTQRQNITLPAGKAITAFGTENDGPQSGYQDVEYFINPVPNDFMYEINLSSRIADHMTQLDLQQIAQSFLILNKPISFTDYKGNTIKYHNN